LLHEINGLDVALFRAVHKFASTEVGGVLVGVSSIKAGDGIINGGSGESFMNNF